MKRKRISVQNELDRKIEASLSEINGVQNYLSYVLDNDEKEINNKISEFELVNSFVIEQNGYNFISTTKKDSRRFTEKDFLKIIGVSKNGLSARSGLYQEHLYGMYIEAKNANDTRYINDIFNKAIEFNKNLEIVKSLKEDTSFMKKWRSFFGNISPVQVFKNSGSMKNINIVKYS